jgi:hypothetical protein
MRIADAPLWLGFWVTSLVADLSVAVILYGALHAVRLNMLRIFGGSGPMGLCGHVYR